jgi:hypothetical protein
VFSTVDFIYFLYILIVLMLHCNNVGKDRGESVRERDHKDVHIYNKKKTKWQS